MIEIEFIGGPLDGTQKLRPEEIRPTLQVPAQPHGYYQLVKRSDEEERPLTVLHLSLKEISESYRYLWITKDDRGKPVPVT